MALKNRVGFLVCLLGVASAVQAEPWSGAYLGLAAGHARVEADSRSRGEPGFFAGIGGDAQARDTQARSLDGSYDARPEGQAYGLYGGYGWRLDSLLIGLEADMQDLGLSDATRLDSFTPVANFPANPLSASLRQESRIDYLATLRARLGYVMDDWLVYGTAGMIWGRVNTRTSYSGSYAFTPTISFDQLHLSDSETRRGFVLGAGAEYALAERWSLRAEYLHFDLGESRQRFSVTSRANSGFTAVATARAETEWTGSLLRLGLGYRF